MKSFYIKQKFMSMQDDFYVYNENDEQVYKIEGSFMKMPKTYTIYDQQQNERARIERKMSKLLPTFLVDVEQSYQFTLKKHLSFLHSRYSIEGEGVEVQGEFLDMEFAIVLNGNEIGRVRQELIALGDTYRIEVYDEAWEMIVITLVVAIDRAIEESFTISSLIDF